jgi:hypothetical protein
MRTALRTATNRAFGDEARNRIREVLTTHETEQNWWADAAGFPFALPTTPELVTILEAHVAVHQAIVEALDRKQAAPANATTLSPSEQQAIDAWEAAAATLDAYNSALPAINEALDQKKAEARTIDFAPLQQGLASLEVSKKRHQQEVIDSYKAYESAVHAKTGAQRAK